MQNFVILIDFTLNSSRGLMFAKRMSSLLNTRLTLLGIDTNTDSYSSELKRKPNTQEQEFLQRFDITEDTEIWVIPPQNIVDELVCISKNTSTQLLIIDGNPFATSQHFLEPETAKSIIQKVKCPALIVSKEIEPHSCSDITLFLPMISDEHYINIESLKNISDVLEAKIHLLSVVDPLISSNYKVIKQLENYASEFQLKDYSINTTYNLNIIDGLQFFNHKKNPDMTAVTWGKNSRYIMLRAFEKLMKQNESALYLML